MDVIHELEHAIDIYPATNVTIDIPGTLNFVSGAGLGSDVINDGDVFAFDVTVANNGHLNMKDTVLGIAGSDWILVNYRQFKPTEKVIVPEKFLPRTVSSPKDITAGRKEVFGRFYLQAVKPTPSKQTDSTVIVYERPLLSIFVTEFQVDLADIMTGQPPPSSDASVDFVDVVFAI